MPLHPAVFAAFRIGAKTYLRQKPVSNPVAHAIGGFALLAIVAVGGLIAGNEFNRDAAAKADALMATFAVPSALYGVELRPQALVDADDSVAADGEISSR
jgi:hypothetical protein